MQQQQQQAVAVQPILRKHPAAAGHEGTVNHVRICEAMSANGGASKLIDSNGDSEKEEAAESKEDYGDRDNPFRPGSALQQEADSILRSCHITRNSVQLGDTTAAQPKASSPNQSIDNGMSDSNLQSTVEDTVRMMSPAQATAAVLPDDNDSIDQSADDDNNDHQQLPQETIVAATTTTAAQLQMLPQPADVTGNSAKKLKQQQHKGKSGNSNGTATSGVGANQQEIVSNKNNSNNNDNSNGKAETVQLRKKLCCGLM